MSPPERSLLKIRLAAVASLLVFGQSTMAFEGRNRPGSDFGSADDGLVVTPAMFGAHCDSTGFNSSGTDDTAAFQKAVDIAESLGRPLKVPGSSTMCRLTATITINRHLIVEGDYCQPVSYNDGTAATPRSGSWLYFDHPGKGLVINDTVGGRLKSQVTGVVIRDICTIRNQPAVPRKSETGGVAPAWAPNDNDFDIDFVQDDLRLQNILLLNPTRGLHASGRITIDGLRGQPFLVGIEIDNAHDTSRISNVHIWPFFADNPSLHAYTQAHLEGLILARDDNPVIDNYTAGRTHDCIHLVGGRYGGPSKVHAVNVDCDFVGRAGLLSEAPNATGQFVNFTTQGADPLPGRETTSSENALSINAPANRLFFSGMRGTYFGGSCVNIAGDGTEIVIEGLVCEQWGLSSKAAVGVVANDGTAIAVGIGAIIRGGPPNARSYGGNGQISTPDTKKLN